MSARASWWRKTRRVSVVVLSSVLVLITFVVAVAFGLLLHLNTPVTRRLLAAQTNSILGGLLTGKVTVERIGGIGFGGLEHVTVRIHDPEGTQVLFADDVTVHVKGVDALKSVLFGKGDITIDAPLASVAHTDVLLDTDPAGNLKLMNAFAVRNPTPDDPNKPAGRGVSVDAPRVVLNHAWVHGTMGTAPPIDADLRSLAAHGHYDPALTKAAIEHLDLEARGLPRGVDPKGRIGGTFSMPSETGQKYGGDVGYEGTLAGMPTTMQAKMDGDAVWAVLDARDASGENVSAAIGDVSIKEQVVLHAEAQGVLPKVGGKVHLAVGKGTVDVDAQADTGEPLTATADVRARALDLQAVLQTLPASNLGFDLHAEATVPKEGEPSASAKLDTVPGMIAGQVAPVVKVRATYENKVADVAGDILDHRVPTHFTARMAPEGSGNVVHTTLDTQVPDIAKVGQLVGVQAAGRASAKVDGTVHLPSKAISAKADVRAANVRYQDMGVDDLRALANVSGTVDRLVVDTGARVEGARTGDTRIPAADVRAKVAVAGKDIEVNDAHVDVARDAVTGSLHASRVKVGDGGIEVDGVSLTGVGEPLRADIRASRKEVKARVEAKSVDLARVGQLIGTKEIRSGTLSIDADVLLHENDAQGTFKLDVEDFAAYQVKGAGIDVDASFDGRRIGLDLTAKVENAGQLRIVAKDLGVNGKPTDPAAWKGVSGRVGIDGSMDMAKVVAMVPDKYLPVDEFQGRLVIAGTLGRDSATAPPEARISVHTQNLLVIGKAPKQENIAGTEVHDVARFRSVGVDVSTNLRIDGTTGDGELALRLTDKNGALVAVDAKATLPYAALLSGAPDAQAQLYDAPVNARVFVPDRTLDRLPEMIAIKNIAGSMGADVQFEGSARKPHLTVRAHGRGVREASSAPDEAGDFLVQADYDGDVANVAIGVAGQNRQLASINSRVDFKIADVLDKKGEGEVPWRADARAKFDRLPLGAIGALSNRRIRGELSGDFVLDRLHENARMQSRLALANMRVGRAEYPDGRIDVDAVDGKLVALIRLNQTDGFLDLRASTGLEWGSAVAPSLDPKQPAVATLKAQAFRAAAALPFVQGALNELDGRIDANAKLQLDPATMIPKLEGQLTYREGVVQVAAIGDELSNVGAVVTLQPNGLIKVDKIHAESSEGEIDADASVQLKGFSLANATANATIPEKKPLSLILQGQPFGEVSAQVHVKAAASDDGKKLAVTVEVPKAQIKLADQLRTGVQELSKSDDVKVGTFSNAKDFLKLRMDKGDTETAPTGEASSTMDVDISLGEITAVRGQQIRVVVGGRPHITIDNTTHVSGQIELKSGRVDVQGKRFEIERGTITFQPDGEPSNPIIVATAKWEAQDGTVVFVDYVGPVKSSDPNAQPVKLRSEPPRPKNEILAMVLFGSADGMAAGGPAPGRQNSDGTARAAVGVGGGLAAQGLSEALDDLAGIQATARIDTTRANNPRPEVEVQISQQVAIQFAHVLGTPPITDPDRNLATLTWRFRRNWSLETTVGDRGKGVLDAIWQKRY